jgi:hypothetical protein
MNFDAYVIDLDDMEQDAEYHLSPHDAMQLGLSGGDDAADEADVFWPGR